MNKQFRPPKCEVSNDHRSQLEEACRTRIMAEVKRRLTSNMKMDDLKYDSDDASLEQSRHDLIEKLEY